MKQKGFVELSLASKVPTVEVKGPFVLNVDLSMAYGFEITPVVYNSHSAAYFNSICNQLCELIRRLPDGYALQLIVDIGSERPVVVERYLANKLEFAECDLPRQEALSQNLAQDIHTFVAQNKFRSMSCYLFVCNPYFKRDPKQMKLVHSGLANRARPPFSAHEYNQVYQSLIEQAQIVQSSLNGMGLSVTELKESQILKLVQSHLNPDRILPALAGGQGKDAGIDYLPQGLPNEIYPSLTLREQLCATDFEMPTPHILIGGHSAIGTLSLKNLPDETFPGMLAPLFFEIAAPARLAVSVEKLLVGFDLALKENTAKASAHSNNVDGETTFEEIKALKKNISRSSISLCALQISAAVYGKSIPDALSRLKQVENQFSRAGTLSTLIEDYNHLPVYLSMLPGAMNTFRRTRTVVDINAAHCLLPFGSWRGTQKASMLLKSRSQDAVTFSPFSDELPAYNGLIVGGTGSGKSFFTNLLLAQHLADQGGAIVVDIGGSYRRLTTIFNGVYIDVGGENSVGLNPFLSPVELYQSSPIERDEKLNFLAGFLEALLCEDANKDEQALIAKLLTSYYKHHEDSRETPTLLAIKAFFADYSAPDIDQILKTKLTRRFDLWTHGPKARHFEKPFHLSMDQAIVSIDLKSIENDQALQAIALYVLSFVIWSSLGQIKNGRKTLVVFDECWALLGNPAAVRLIENLVRTARKYGAALWCLSQSMSDFTGSAIGPALLQNSFSRVLLRHSTGHEAVADICDLSENALRAFKRIQSVRGQYSEIFLQCLDKSELLRVHPSPLSYWMATTNADDKRVEHQVLSANPNASSMKILLSLAERFPNGVLG